MADRNYVGKGWAFKYGVNISINQAAIAALTPNQYGDVKLTVMARREPDERSKATHMVFESEPYTKNEQKQEGDIF